MLAAAQQMQTWAGTGVFGDIVIILATAGVVALVMGRLRMATVPAYLIAGAIIGPGVLKLIHSPDQVNAVADLAVVLLMFGIGLQVDMKVLSHGIGRMLVVAVGATVLMALTMWPGWLLLNLSAAGALAAALAMAMSSTVVVLRVYQERRELGTPTGRTTLSILVLQDLLAIAVLLLMPLLGWWHMSGGAGIVHALEATGTKEAIASLWVVVLDVMLAIVGVAAIVLVGRMVLPRVLTEAARLKSGGEVLTVLSIAMAMGAAALTSLLGLNTALGAFLAGFLLAGTPFRHHLGGQVGVIRDVFGAIFFTAIGMHLLPRVLAEDLLLIVGGTVLVLVSKSIAFGVMAWTAGASGNVALRVGASLSQAGEFSIVLISAAAANHLLNEEAVGTLVSIVVLSLMVTPWLIRASATVSRTMPRLRAAPWIKDSSAVVEDPADRPAEAGSPDDASHAPPPPPPVRKQAIIAGFGLVGRAVADELMRMGVRTTIVEMNPSTVTRQAKLGRSIVFGDISSPDVLESAGIHTADALILTIPDAESTMRACQTVRRMRPGVFIVARTNFVSQGIAAAGLGANGVVVEEMATAKEMERLVKEALGDG